jgi:hypothetical protein
MGRSLLILLRRRLFWLTLLLTVWLLCSGQAQAGPLADRLEAFPDWGTKPGLPRAQGDLIYPDWLRGEWQLTSTLIDLVAPLAPDVVTPGFEGNHEQVGVPMGCPVRFVAMAQPALGLVPRLTGDVQTVADRAFNGLNLARAYLGEAAVKAVKVDPENPNRQVTLLSRQRQLESTVTARATETLIDGGFITIERFQQVFRGRTIPYFNEVETTTAYRRQPQVPSESDVHRHVMADQVTVVYLSPQDPNFFKAQNQPVALYRYRLELDPLA